MSYIINNSRGNIVAIVADGTVNTSATDLTLVGRAVTNYGGYENENYVYLLENFANSSAPLLPILGQLWYNSDTDLLSAYTSANTWMTLAKTNSPALTGIPTAPTASLGTSTTQIATTAFVLNQLQGANNIVASGNITGGNILTGGIVSAGGAVTAVGNITGGNILTAGIVSATGNITGANFIGNVISPAGSNVSTTGNVSGGNVLTGGIVSAVGGVFSSGDISASGAVTAVGNVTGGNIRTSGSISAGGTVTSASVSTTGNVTGGNVVSTNSISATGNITTLNTVIANTVIANTVITTGTTSAFRLPNLTQAQINALSANNGDMVYNTTTNLPQIYQSGTWQNFTISYYS